MFFRASPLRFNVVVDLNIRTKPSKVCMCAFPLNISNISLEDRCKIIISIVPGMHGV